MKWFQLTLLLPLLLPGIVQAQPVTAPDKTQQMINELKQLTEQAERERSASHRFIDQLEGLIARYDEPWQQRVLFDNFRDGDFLRNPVWHSNSDDFWVRANIGLRTELYRNHRSGYRTRPRPDQNPSPEGVILDMLLGGDDQGTTRGRTARPFPVRADLSTSVAISNAFSITLNITDMGRNNREDGEFEFGPYQGANLESGYRLVYRNGSRPALFLVNYRQHTRTVLARYDRKRLLGDGNMHTLKWMRSANGQMRVLLDGKERMHVRDQRYRDRFSGFVMTNLGGDYAIRSVDIHAASRQILPMRSGRVLPRSVR